MENKIHKIIYKANLNLKTALHIGCAQESPVGAFELMKNGAGEYFIPGTSIAGVFFNTLIQLINFDEERESNSFLFAKCNADNNAIYFVPEKKRYLIDKLKPFPTLEFVEKKQHKKNTFFRVVENRYHNEIGEIKKEFDGILKSDDLKPFLINFASPIIFRSVDITFEEKKNFCKIRNRVKIDRETKTAKEGALFNYWEIEPENVNFDLKIEIDNLSVKNSTEDINTLKNWIKMVFASWKNEGVFLGAHNTSGNGFCNLNDVESWIIDENDFVNYLNDVENYLPVNELPDDVKKRYKTWTITVNMDDEEDGYGTNALLIKGGASHRSLARNPSDGVFINTGKRLFIPGSSLKGTFSMFLDKYGYKDEYLNKFFGQKDSDGKLPDYQGYIYFPDLIFSKDMNDDIKKHLINIERHAEDEFTRAVFGSSKFNEERLFYARASEKIRIPVKIYEENKGEIKKLFDFMKNGCQKRLISLGANGCYPKITIVED